MSFDSSIRAAIFDMDGLLIDSEPLWDKAELEVIASLGVDISLRESMKDTLGLRIDMVVELWYQRSPWAAPGRDEVVRRIIDRAIELVAEQRPLLPGVEHALQLCRRLDLKIGLASASPLHMQRQVLRMFNLDHYFDVLMSAETLPYSKPHPEVYLNAAHGLGVSPAQCVTLEDSVNGMIATKAARMRSIVIPQTEFRADARWVLADYKLDSLNQLTAEHLV
ncbi:hexitol phosphatase HxpB [Pectobacterium punjabense]|uniref:Hexitol phosphatase HxpB n=1 Tax=Pectobacterium punjabense TaxID=2108399 RepID=A0ABX6L3F5_9GAMM|nr:hexitol phosphatase HxpB [Pectobacterium punjabense]MBS4432550.1 hexitol phosphatase HxpB [Pectobacterium punjabense]MDG0796320.1 hexitol phosphatase HxpB [Pectobacterium punjabense]PTA62712.1 hexitol phosphatase HxpB [Pectobacterium punjabense]QJA20272.1 hexitol phosphatase HxpB [Pectobacterium punjabense]